MKSLTRFFHSLVLLSLLTLSAAAESTVDLQPNDNLQAILQRQVGQSIELRMKSGEKIGGKLEKLTEKFALLSQLTGAEYFDAVVVLDNIAAVVVRAKK